VNLRGVLLGRARALRRSLFRRGSRRAAKSPRGPLYSLAAVALATWITSAAFAGFFAALARSGASPAEMRAALALALDLALLGLLLLDLEGAISALIMDRDLDLLRLAPLSPRAILGIKLLDALPLTATPLVVVALPALIVFARIAPAGGVEWLAVPLVLALLWAIPLGLGIALTLALLARLPGRRVRESLGLVTTLGLLALWLLNLFVLPRAAAAEGEPFARVRALLSAAAPLLSFTPGGWAAALFGGAAPGDFARSALALAGAAGAGLALAAFAAGRWLAPVLAAARTPVARAGPRRGFRVPARRIPLVVTVMRRDRLLFVRDWTALGDVLMGAVLWTLLPVLGLTFRPLHSPALVRAMLLTLSVGMGYEIAARAFPLERRGAAWMRLAPVPAGAWAMARLLSAGAMALALVAIAGLSLGLAARFGPWDWLGLGVVLPALALSVSLGLWTGAAFGDPGWTSARSVLTLGGRLVAVAFVMLQVTGWLAVTVLPEIFGGSALLFIWAPAVVAAGLAAIALAALSRRIARAGQIH
jgi:hypothetical protein